MPTTASPRRASGRWISSVASWPQASRFVRGPTPRAEAKLTGEAGATGGPPSARADERPPRIDTELPHCRAHPTPWAVLPVGNLRPERRRGNSMTKRTRVGRVGAVALISVLVLAGAACSSDTATTGATAATTGPTTEATTPVPAGLPAFYGVPDPLPPGEPGDVIAKEQVDVAGVDGTVWRVMYQSRSIAGDDIAVTGLVIVPDGPAPADGWPVVTWAHGTVGVADICAPSVDAASIAPLANPLLDAGLPHHRHRLRGHGHPGPPSVHRRGERGPRCARHRARRPDDGRGRERPLPRVGPLAGRARRHVRRPHGRRGGPRPRRWWGWWPAPRRPSSS